MWKRGRDLEFYSREQHTKAGLLCKQTTYLKSTAAKYQSWVVAQFEISPYPQASS